MEIQFLRQTALDSLVKSVSENISQYALTDTPWVEDYFLRNEIKVPILKSELTVSEIDLVLGNDAANDATNAIRFYDSVRGLLKPVQATDRRLWVALTHTTFYKYMHSRWPVENVLNGSGTNGTVTDRYFLARGVFRNGIARLYWIPELTYDESLDDPYAYTKFLIGNQDLINQVDGRSLCRNRTTLKTCLKVLMEGEPLTESQKRLYFENLCKRGGVTVLDALPSDSLEDICKAAFDSVASAKQITNGCKVHLKSVSSNAKMIIEIQNGKAYVGKTRFKTKPENLSRLTIGKDVEISKVKYRITDIT